MATVNGTNGADSLSGTSGIDTINGLNGNDTLKGFGGADRLDGGNGIDTASYFNSATGVGANLATGRGIGGDADGDTLLNIENLVGSSFNDTLTGDDNNNELIGLEGNDILKGGGGADRLGGGAGDDILKGGGGSDELNGGAGSDTADYSNSPDFVVIDFTTGFAGVGDASFDTLISIENITGSAFNDRLTGDHQANAIKAGAGDDQVRAFEGDDWVDGGAGNDILNGMAGNDTMFGSAGDDWLDGGGDSDTMSGGTGNDTFIVDSSADVATEAVGEGFDRVFTTATYALAAGSEIELLTAFDTNSTNAMDLVGNGFDNQIVGNDGNNTIVGSSDQDGGLFDGLDTMTGRNGGDVFVWSSVAETRPAADQADVVTDFNRAQGDLIAVNLIDANETIAGNQDFTFVGVVDFSTRFFTGAGQIGYFTTATDTFILLNTKVDAGATDFEEGTIRLVGVHTPDASWFVL
jgi:Ca2+-binding RTX toxin-like protein